MRVFSLGGRRDDRLQIHVNYWHHPVAASKDPQMRPWLLIDRPVMKKYNRDDKKGLIEKINMKSWQQNYVVATYGCVGNIIFSFYSINFAMHDVFKAVCSRSCIFDRVPISYKDNKFIMNNQLHIFSCLI